MKRIKQQIKQILNRSRKPDPQAHSQKQAQQIKKLQKERDALKADMRALHQQNDDIRTRVASFVSDYQIFLLEKLNRLDRLLFNYKHIGDIQSCDVVVAHHFDSLQTALALKHASDGRIKILFDCVEHPIHNLRTPGKLAYYFEDHPIRDVSHQVLNDEMIKQCDGVIYTSPGHGTYFETLRVPSHLVYNTKEAASQTPSDRCLRSDTNAKNDDYVVMFLNNVYPRGGFDEFMDMVATFDKGYKFGFLGKVRDTTWEEKFDDLRYGDYANRVTQLDLERPNRIVSYVSQADCVLCSFDASHEGYAGLVPIRFFDAVMAGVPIVAPEISQVGQLVDQYGIGVVYKKGMHLTAVRAACEMKQTAGFKSRSEKARAVFGWEAASKPFVEAVQEIVPDIRNAHAVVLANKPLRNHNRTRNFAQSLQNHCAKTDVVGLIDPDEELKVRGVTYHALAPQD